MELLEKLIELLETSVKKNGEKPLTNKWLLNILKLAYKDLDDDDYRGDVGDLEF